MVIKPISVELEYKKNPELHKEDIVALQEWINKQPHLPKCTELELILFLHSCYYRSELAKTTIDTFYTVRSHCPEFFTNRDAKIQSLNEAMDVVSFHTLPDTTPEGYKVIGCKLIITDASRYVFSDALKLFSMLVDLWLLEEGTAPGHVVYFDMEGVSLGHVARLGIMTMKKFLFYLQEALPFRLKGLHFVNAVPFTDKILALMKPFMKKELMDVLHIHPKPEGFYKFVPKNILTSDLGGPNESAKDYQLVTRKKISENYQWFIDDEKNRRVDETKRPGKPKNPGDVFGVEGSFKKLDID